MDNIDTTGKVLTFKGVHRSRYSGKMQPFTYRIAVEVTIEKRIELVEPDRTGSEKSTFVLVGEKSR